MNYNLNLRWTWNSLWLKMRWRIYLTSLTSNSTYSPIKIKINTSSFNLRWSRCRANTRLIVIQHLKKTATTITTSISHFNCSISTTMIGTLLTWARNHLLKRWCNHSTQYGHCRTYLKGEAQFHLPAILYRRR